MNHRPTVNLITPLGASAISLMKSLLTATLLLFAVSGYASDSFRLPFAGTWFVAQGGDTPNVNHHMQVRSQAFGLDFAKVGGPAGRALNNGSGNEIKDYFSWGEPVLAPTGGTIVALENALPDNAIGVHDIEHPLGNHVVLRTTGGAFVFLAHFQKGSVAVAAGAKVKAGDTLGKCGNSGNSAFPHIHMHTQDTADFTNGLGQHVIFSSINVELSGKKFERVDWPLIRGLFVSNTLGTP